MLSKEQKHILYEEGTEPPGSSSLNYEKREGAYFVLVAEPNYLNQVKNMIVEVGGHHFLNFCLNMQRLYPHMT